MKTLLFLCLLLSSTLAFAGKPDAVTDLNAALEQAKSENKILFLEFGRKECANCQALRAMIKSKKVMLPESKFVYADVSCDDPSEQKAFQSKFKVKGTTLPFVVIAAPDGTQLVSRSGGGTDKDFNQLIHSAKKAGSKS